MTRIGLPDCPCRGCEHRTAECHGKCRNYKDWKTAQSMERERIASAKRGDQLMTEHEIRKRLETARQWRWKWSRRK